MVEAIRPRASLDILLRAIVILRARISPDMLLEVKAGEIAHEHNRIPVEYDLERELPPGVFVETAWARDRFFRRVPVKLEIMTGAAPEDGTPRDWLDLVISAGAAVRPGRYAVAASLLACQLRVMN